MSFSQKDFTDWQSECAKVARALEQENQRIAGCESQIKLLHEKEKNIEEKSSTASIEGLLAISSVCISQNTMVHIEVHVRELQEQLKELKEGEQYAFFHSLENDPRACVEKLLTSLKDLVQTKQDDYTNPQSSNFRHWLSEANREIEFLARQQEESKEDEKIIYQRKLFQLVGYIRERSEMIQLLQDYPLNPNDCATEFQRLKETHPIEFERSSLTAFIEKEREQFVAANQQLQAYLITCPRPSAEYRAFYAKADQMLKQVNEQPDDYLDIKLKTKILISTHELLQNPQNSDDEDRMQRYKVLANTVRRRESSNCATIAGTMLMIAAGIALIAGLMCLSISTAGIAPAFGIAAGLLLSGGSLFAWGERQKINHKMHQITRKNLPEENHIELGPRPLLTSL